MRRTSGKHDSWSDIAISLLNTFFNSITLTLVLKNIDAMKATFCDKNHLTIYLFIKSFYLNSEQTKQTNAEKGRASDSTQRIICVCI